MEALVAQQVDINAESRGILHRNVHGYIKGRGTDTTLLEVWESVLEDIDGKKVVARCVCWMSVIFWECSSHKPSKKTRDLWLWK